jgi:hypothetical protein
LAPPPTAGRTTSKHAHDFLLEVAVPVATVNKGRIFTAILVASCNGSLPKKYCSRTLLNTFKQTSLRYILL